MYFYLKGISVELKIRKIVTQMEEIYSEGFKSLDKPIKKCVVSAVIENPFAGSYKEDLTFLSDVGEILGKDLTEMCIAAMAVAPNEIHSYGKGAIVGLDGELEHAAAILHPKLGKPMRDVIGGGKAIIPSAKKSGGAGTTLDVPLHYKDAAFVRTHYDAIEARVPDAPKNNEIVVCIALTTGGRPHPRIGGLEISGITENDGLR